MDKTRIYLTESLATKEEHKSSSSLIGIIITIVGYIIILGGLTVCGYISFARPGIDLYIVIIGLISCIITGILIIGFGYIINLLYNIKEKL